jgi:hypothetical protein
VRSGFLRATSVAASITSATRGCSTTYPLTKMCCGNG